MLFVAAERNENVFGLDVFTHFLPKTGAYQAKDEVAAKVDGRKLNGGDNSVFVVR